MSSALKHPDPLAAALAYIGRGWAPVPFSPGREQPQIEDWRRLRISAEDAPRHFADATQNVGLVLGSASGGLVVIKLLSEEAKRAGDFFLPPTDLTFGGAGDVSNFVYRTDARERREANRWADAAFLCGNCDETCVLLPPSVDANGHRLEWAAEGVPAKVDYGRLSDAFGYTVAAAIIARQLKSRAATTPDGWQHVCHHFHDWKPEASVHFTAAALHAAGQYVDRDTILAFALKVPEVRNADVPF